MNKNKIYSSPKVRKFARELGANISEIKGTQRLERISEEDVKKYVNSKINESKSIVSKEKETIKNEFKHSDFGEVEIKEIPRVKK